ncbi:MAG TPA: hypothetical protein VHX38_09160 [Pseudonocardiaceae bacterium]|nr:hypothetical protein [Pseudonocardiaceae bacterium]
MPQDGFIRIDHGERDGRVDRVRPDQQRRRNMSTVFSARAVSGDGYLSGSTPVGGVAR